MLVYILTLCYKEIMIDDRLSLVSCRIRFDRMHRMAIVRCRFIFLRFHEGT